MAHPMAGQAQASQKRRLSKLTGKPGKAWGSSNMYKKSSYPSTNAGTERSFTISGGSAKKNAGRKAQKLQTGGLVGGRPAGVSAGDGGGGLNRGRRRGKPKQKNTTNIIIADRGGAQAPPRAVPVPVPRPVPVPVGGAAPAPRPVVAAPAAAAPAAAPAMPPVRPPMPMPGGMPGMASGGGVGNFGPGPSYHNWGEGYKSGGFVKKADGGFLKDSSPDGYRGYPHSPTTDVDDAVSGKKDGGAIKKAGGGAIKKAQLGGVMGTGRRSRSLQMQPGSFRPGAVPGTSPGAPGPGGTRSPVVPLTGGRQTRPGLGMKKGGAKYKDGGHTDEAQDKKLIARMIKKEEKAEKKADGGGVGFSASDQDSSDPALISSKYRNQGTGFNTGGSVKGGGANAYRRKRNNASAKSIPAKTEI